MTLPYDMGNAGDLLKHGVLAEFPAAREGDLLLIDPFFDNVLDQRAPAVVPLMATMAERAAVLLFALNPEPRDRAGQRFDTLLEDHLHGAWRMTCPPLPGTRIKGESIYHAEVVLAARLLRDGGHVRDLHVLWRRLTDYARDLADVLDVPAKRLEPRVVGH